MAAIELYRGQKRGHETAAERQAASANERAKHMDLGLAGKVFIVTAGTAGLGLAGARSLLEEGANVMLSGRTEENFLRAQSSLSEFANRIAFVAGDNADADLPDRLKTGVMDRWGRLDGMLVSVGGPTPGKAMAVTDDAWRTAFEALFLGTVRLVRELSPSLTDGGSVALVLACTVKEAHPTTAVSTGLRPGLALLVKSFAEELGSRSIRVNALLPGMIASERLTRMSRGGSLPEVSSLPLKRIGQPEEFGRVATFLLSPAASYVTGASIAVDGGYMKML